MVQLIGNDLNKEDFNRAFSQIRAGDNHLIIESPGGDFRAALNFVDALKVANLEGSLIVDIKRAGSAAAFVALTLNCLNRRMQHGGLICLHGGHIEAEANVLFEGNGLRDLKQYYKETKKLVLRYFPEKLDEFVATNEVIVTSQECLDRGAVNMCCNLE